MILNVYILKILCMLTLEVQVATIFYSLVVISFTIFFSMFLSLFKRFTTSFGTVATTSRVCLTLFRRLDKHSSLWGQDDDYPPLFL